MKKKILLSTLFAVICSNAFAQEAITNSNFPLEAYNADLVLIDPIDYINPTEGSEQTWDYSSLPNTVDSSPGLYEANHPDFPDAAIYKSYLPTFDVYEFQRDDYYEQNENGRYRVGSVFLDLGYSVTDKTGGALDSLWFGGVSVGYEGDDDLEVKFPLEYQTQWDVNYTTASPFKLSVAAFGLNQAPGSLRQTSSKNFEVTGYGTLVLPKVDGSASDPINVMMLKSTVTVIDSVYLNNAPAPPALMAAFGLTQGSSFSVVDYLFYTPGYQDEVMILSPDYNTGIYRIDATTLDIPFLENSNNVLAAYPNPIASGELFTIQNNVKSTVGSITITDLLGKVVFQENVTDHNNTHINIVIPAELTQGVYLYQLNDTNGKLIGSDMLSIK